MNRLEVLLEALKETDKLLVSLVDSRSQWSIAPTDEARRRVDEITTAILLEKGYQGENAMCAPPLNPALENVLAKLRNIYHNKSLLPKCSDGDMICHCFGESIQWGDLRRWVESEVKP